ncbi:class I SAM-dependent methyltransferase [Leucobacter allii]|uniref:class I SAM-dependent methyltransferase n=1 Tax=Leucobacter allii TaxID=2932247 RepID=UPI001FD06A1C|nr:methyltransferase [Leucobacter allii]UOR03037.1 class I SAM-dependent methyltransferase [Leucobacter allii]
MDPELIDRLRTDLDSAGYDAPAVTALLGAAADDARRRGVRAPARRALDERGGTRLALLIRLFLLGDPLTGEELADALPALGPAGAHRLGLVAAAGDAAAGCRAALSLNPVEIVDARSAEPVAWRILSDLDDQLRGGPARPDHVMGVGGATRSLIAQAPPGEVERALDLGTGCGVVALHLALRGPVVATDISERALELARANARLNGLEERIEFRRGDLFAPVSGEAFELILSNPPFVITPRGAGGPVYAYRDGGLAGDALAERVIAEGPARLAPGGQLLCLANWESPWGGSGLERVRGWIETAAGATGPLDAWVIERDRVDPAGYAETWARDGGARPGGADFERLMSGWLDDFAARRVVAIGLGAVRIRRRGAVAGADGATPGADSGGASTTVVHVDQAAGAYSAEPPGARLAAAFEAGVAAARMDDAAVLEARWVLDDAVAEEREHRPGEEAPRAIALRTERPIARRVTADPLLAAAMGACDGELSLRRIADALAQILEIDAAAAAEALVASVRELTWFGMLAVAGTADASGTAGASGAPGTAGTRPRGTAR